VNTGLQAFIVRSIDINVGNVDQWWFNDCDAGSILDMTGAFNSKAHPKD